MNWYASDQSTKWNTEKKATTRKKTWKLRMISIRPWKEQQGEKLMRKIKLEKPSGNILTT